MSEPEDADQELLRRAARAVSRLLELPDEGIDAIAPVILGHLGGPGERLPVLTEELESWELPNLQLALDDLLGEAGWSGRILGVAGQGKRFSGLGLSDLVSHEGHAIGPPEYVNAPVGPDATLACLDFAVILLTSPTGPIALFVKRGDLHSGMSGLAIEVMAPDERAGPSLIADLRRRMDRHDVYRGQVITVEATRMGQQRVVFVQRPGLDASELVLPEGLLDRLERHVAGPSRHREALLASGRHLARGVLLWGPPGTGKTLTVRYLVGRLTGATVILLSGGALGMVSGFAGLARRLAPAVVVLEDVDLIAEERVFGPFGESATLFELMNQMSGLGEDADVAFVLTTNRPDALEPALAARPGRVDLALEIPLPDAAARLALLELYARGLDARIDDWDAVVARTEGMTASFFRELLRKAALEAAEAGRPFVDDATIGAVLDDLLSERSALTRVLLSGSTDAAGRAAPMHRAWLEIHDE
jgi:hypothetical protein